MDKLLEPWAEVTKTLVDRHGLFMLRQRNRFGVDVEGTDLRDNLYDHGFLHA